MPTGFVFSPDGRYLYGSSYFTGVSNIFRYDLATKKLDAVTNAETGFFRPIPLGGRRADRVPLLGRRLRARAIEPRPLEDVSADHVPRRAPGRRTSRLKNWMVGSPADVPFDSMRSRQRRYRLAGGLQLESFYPVLQGYKDTSAIGCASTSPIRCSSTAPAWSASYSPCRRPAAAERVHLKADYQRYDWRGLFELERRGLLRPLRPDQDQPQGLRARVGKKHADLRSPRRLDLDSSGTLRPATSIGFPKHQNVAVDVDRLYTLDVKLSDQDIRSSLGHVDDEKGRRWSFVGGGERRQRPRSCRCRARSIAASRPAGHSSIWLRTAAGFSPETARAVRELLLRGVRQQLGRPSRREALSRVYSFPGARSTRSPGGTS